MRLVQDLLLGLRRLQVHTDYWNELPTQNATIVRNKEHWIALTLIMNAYGTEKDEA